MIKFFKISILIVIMICCIACEGNNDDSLFNNEQFQQGVEYGIEDTFLRLNNAIALHNSKGLFSGDTWNTKDFILTFSDHEAEGNRYLFYDFKLKKGTIGECYELQNLFFYIYAMSEKSAIVLKEDDYFDYGLLYHEGSADEFIKGNTAEASIKLPDNEEVQTMMIIIVIEGNLYTAVYNT